MGRFFVSDCFRRFASGVFLALSALLAFVSVHPANAAEPTGRLAVSVRSSEGLYPAGAWVRLEREDGTILDAPSFVSESEGIARVYGIPAGTYRLRVFQSSFDAPEPPTVQIQPGAETAVKMEMTPVPTIPVAAEAGKSWRLLPVNPIAGADFVDPTYLDPASPNYAWDTSRDPFLKKTWIQEIPVPSNVGGSSTGGVAGWVSDFGYFWYRLTLPILPNDDRLKNRLWLLQDFAVTAEDNTYWNSRLLGTTRKNADYDSSTYRRSYPLALGDLKTDGSANVVAIYGRHQVGEAGITSGEPSLVALPRGTGNLEVSFKDDSGAALDEVSVMLTAPGGAFHPSESTMAGQPAHFFGVPEGTYRVSIYRPFGMEAVSDATVQISMGATTTLNVTGHSLPTLSLNSASLEAQGLPGWRLLPIPSAQKEAGLNDVSLAAPDYPDPYVDPMFNTEWSPDVPVPSDLSAGDPPDPTRPVQNDSVFWYRLKLTVPADWSATLPAKDLELAGFRFSPEDWTYFNGVLIGHTADTRARRYRIPRSLVHFVGTNILAIKGRQTQGWAGIFMGSVELSFTPEVVNPLVQRGDVNGDGSITLVDVILALSIAVGNQGALPSQLQAGDLLRHGKVDLADVVLLLKAAVGTVSL